MYDIAVIGAGPAGLTAAIYACRAGFSVAVFEGNIYGGQVGTTYEIENYPAIERISGADFSINLYNQATAQGAQVLFEEVKEVELEGKVKKITTASNTYEAKAIIFANGVNRRKLECPGEERLTGRGVSYCATCDGAFFRGKEVAIVGGGNSALEESLFLSNNCSKVYLIHRRDQFRGNKVLVDAVLAKPNIHILWDSVVTEIAGENAVERVTVRNVHSEAEASYDVAAVFVAIGLQPDNRLISGKLKLDEAGYVAAGENCATNVEGVYVAGDTRAKPLRQIITAASDGAVAAYEAGNYLNFGA